jgi:hypothetical protein
MFSFSTRKVLPMKRLVLTVTVFCLVLGVVASDLYGQTEDDLVDEDQLTKLGQTGFQFLSVSADARAAALGSAVTAAEQGAIGLFYNPATIAMRQQTLDVALGQNQWFTDINYNFGSIAFRPAGGQYGTIGVSVMAVDYGTLQGTVRADNEDGYQKTGTFAPSAYAAGVGYARAVTDRFSVGGQVKYASQNLGSAILSRGGETTLPRFDELRNGTMAFDFGVLYRTGFRSLNFAASVRNFAREISYAERSFELPLSFQLGLSMDMIDFTQLSPDMHSFNLLVDAVHPRAFSEQIKVGGEYKFMNTVALRAGYIYPSDQEGINLGVGVEQSIQGIQLGLDYAYSDFEAFGSINRIALRLGFE